MHNQDIKYFISTELGKRLPFAITSYAELISSDDIFIPSLRDFHVIFWIKNGTGKFVIDFQEYEFKAGSLILLSKDQLNHFLPFDKSQTEIISIGFTPEFIYKTDNDLNHLFKFNANAYRKVEQCLVITEDFDSKLQTICNEMFLISKEWDKKYLAKGFYHYLCLFLIQCEMMLESQFGQDESQNNDNISTFLMFNELLEQNYKTEFKVDFYAEKLNITVKAVAKLTKTHFKMPPKMVIDQRRILEIKRQLQGTSKSGKTIAYELNFGEPTNMFKFFKKHVGLTPKEFREQK